MRLPACIVIPLMPLVSAIAVAGDGGAALRGTLTIRGASIVDPPAAESKTTHAAFLVIGAAAKAMYDALPGSPTRDRCLDDGSLRKQAGNLACVRLAGDGGYECDFAIELATQNIEAGRAC